jgi:hypothetical protein
MAGDWIKMRVDLPADPAVVRMAAILGIDRFAVVGRLHSVWGWADAHADRHGRVTLVSHDWIDSLSQRPGFAAAMSQVGWLETTDAGLTFPRFERHMGGSAKLRAMATERKRKSRRATGSVGKDGGDGRTDGGEIRSRRCHDSVTVVSQKNVTREEKRREEKKEDPTGGATAEPPPAVDPPPVKPRVRKEPTGPHAEAVRVFCDSWQQAHGSPYPFDGPKDGAAMKAILAHLGGDLDRVREVVGRYFANADSFFSGHPLSLLRSQLPRFLVDGPPARSTPRRGFESHDDRMMSLIEDTVGGSP